MVHMSLTAHMSKFFFLSECKEQTETKKKTGVQDKCYRLFFFFDVWDSMHALSKNVLISPSER